LVLAVRQWLRWLLRFLTSGMLLRAPIRDSIPPYQPYHADPNSYFDVQISAWAASYEGNTEMPRFGALLPVGWVPQDSLAYFDSTSNFVGTLIYSDSLSQEMANIDPPPENYYWWVAQDTIYIGGSTYNFDLRIYTDAQTGNFFIDYMLGNGIAIPHGKLASLDRLYGLFARLEQPIDFHSIDEQPVDLVFLLLAPETAGADHLKALARVSRLLRDATVCEKLRGTDDNEALFVLLTESSASQAA